MQKEKGGACCQRRKTRFFGAKFAVVHWCQIPVLNYTLRLYYCRALFKRPWIWSNAVVHSAQVSAKGSLTKPNPSVTSRTIARVSKLPDGWGCRRRTRWRGWWIWLSLLGCFLRFLRIWVNLLGCFLGFLVGCFLGFLMTLRKKQCSGLVLVYT